MVEEFAAAHSQGLQAEHEWNWDPAEFPLYHAGPRKGQPRCPAELQAICDWKEADCPRREYALVFDLILLVTANGQHVWACLSHVKAAFPSVPGFAWNWAYRRGCESVLHRVPP